MYNIIPLILILVCLAIILIIVLKKLPFLATFDVDKMPKEKSLETKEKIIDERVKRKFKFFYEKISPLFKIISNLGQRKIKQAQDKLKNLEEKYKNKKPKEALITKEEFEGFEKELSQLLIEAKELVDREEYAEAEKKYIEIIGLDAKNIEAYRGLGNLYFLQKNYEDAKQTFSHILKLNKMDDKAYAKLGKIAEQEGNFDKAKKDLLRSIDIEAAPIHYFELAEVCFKMEKYKEALSNLNKALKIEPNNPKYLDLLVTVSIIIKDKNKSTEALNRLKEVNPENKKIEEFEEQINELG
jgi:tetratricopeptide (TPR) repeat protein